jgi:hypothetical protein
MLIYLIAEASGFVFQLRRRPSTITT